MFSYYNPIANVEYHVFLTKHHIFPAYTLIYFIMISSIGWIMLRLSYLIVSIILSVCQSSMEIYFLCFLCWGCYCLTYACYLCFVCYCCSTWAKVLIEVVICRVNCCRDCSTASTILQSIFWIIVVKNFYISKKHSINFYFSIMGCSQPSSNAIQQARIAEIPCTAEEIGRYINDIRAYPGKYA